MNLLFVIDYQVDFVNGALGFPGAEKLDEGIARKVRTYGNGHVYFTRDTHSENYLATQEGRNLPVPHCIRGTDGWHLYGETRAALEAIDAIAIDKYGFGMSPEQILSLPDPKQVDLIELVGLVSNICVLSNAVILKSRYPEADIIVDGNLTASFDPALHEAALKVLKGIQVSVL